MRGQFRVADHDARAHARGQPAVGVGYLQLDAEGAGVRIGARGHEADPAQHGPAVRQHGRTGLADGKAADHRLRRVADHQERVLLDHLGHRIAGLDIVAGLDHAPLDHAPERRLDGDMLQVELGLVQGGAGRLQLGQRLRHLGLGLELLLAQLARRRILQLALGHRRFHLRHPALAIAQVEARDQRSGLDQSALDRRGLDHPSARLGLELHRAGRLGVAVDDDLGCHRPGHAVHDANGHPYRRGCRGSGWRRRGLLACHQFLERPREQPAEQDQREQGGDGEGRAHRAYSAAAGKGCWHSPSPDASSARSAGA